MKNVEFCYWLQGFFELGRDGGIDESQMKSVKNHLALSRKVEGKLDEFCSWLDGFVEDKLSLDIDSTNKVRDKLASKFKHEIDLTYPGKQKTLNDLHGKPSGAEPVFRC